MNINNVNNYNQNNPKNLANQQFGNFIKVEVYKGYKGNRFYMTKEFTKHAEKRVDAIVTELKSIFGAKLNFFTKKPSQNPVNQIPFDNEIQAKTLFIEDNNGKNLFELLNTAKIIKEKGLSFNFLELDLFAKKPENPLKLSNLEKYAFDASTEDMVKL